MRRPERDGGSGAGGGELEPRRAAGSAAPDAAPGAAPEGPRYGRYVGLLGVIAIVLITINTIVTKPNGATGIAPGARVAPFAVPLAAGSLNGEADVATHAYDGLAGKVPACALRSAQILNICQLYEQGPVVFALFVDSGSCVKVLDDLQSLAAGFPQVRFAAVAIRGDRDALRRLVRSHRFTFPVGIDKDGALAVLYKVASCPQVSFIDRGGLVQSPALLRRVSRVALRDRVSALLAASSTPAHAAVAPSGSAPAG